MWPNIYLPAVSAAVAAGHFVPGDACVGKYTFNFKLRTLNPAVYETVGQVTLSHGWVAHALSSAESSSVLLSLQVLKGP